MKITVYTPEGKQEILADELPAHLASSSPGILWVDITGPPDEEIEMMRQVFNFHPLAIEDTRNERQRPKIEQYPEYLFGILNPVRVSANKDGLVFREVNVFLGHKYIVTAHKSADPIIAEMRRRIESAHVSPPITCGYLMYMLVDVVVDTYFTVLDFIEDEIEAVGDQMLTRPRRSTTDRLFRLKRNLAEFSRVVRQQRQMFNLLTRRDLSYIDHEMLGYHLRDVHDHLNQISDLIESFRDMLSGVFDLYMSSVSNQVNLVVTRLTVITICIGVLTVIGGFYGMNFEHTWPPFNAWWGVPFVIGLMIVSMGAVIWFSSKRGWY